MAFLTPNILIKDPHTQIFLVGATIVALIGIIFGISLYRAKEDKQNPGPLTSFLRFFYASFLKPHTGDGLENGQQDALESFYKAQAGVYDATRKKLLRGREDMLGLVAAQLVQKAGAKDGTHDARRIWVDVRNFLSFSTEDVYAKQFIHRSVVAPGGTSKPCPSSCPYPTSSPAYTSSISLPPSAQ